MKKFALCLLLIIVCLLIGCEGSSNITEEKLLTKEEFIQLIQENDLGVTAESFNGVDIDEFIEHHYITREVFGKYVAGNYSLSKDLEWYIEDAPRREEVKRMAPYLVRELKYADSVDEEYKAFVNGYFLAMQMDAAYIGTEESGIDQYEIKYNDGKTTYFSFCQTSKSRRLPISKGEKDREENYMIKQYSGDLNYYLNIYYSKNAKYLMFFDGTQIYSFEESLYLIQTFCELED